MSLSVEWRRVDPVEILPFQVQFKGLTAHDR